MPKAYTLKTDRFGRPAGTKVVEYAGHDYGLARDDTWATGIEHVSVTEGDDPRKTPFFTVPVADLEAA